MTIYQCRTCDGKPAFCFPDCFEKFHLIQSQKIEEMSLTTNMDRNKEIKRTLNMHRDTKFGTSA